MTPTDAYISARHGIVPECSHGPADLHETETQTRQQHRTNAAILHATLMDCSAGAMWGIRAVVRTGLLALVRPRAGLVVEEKLGRLHQRAHRDTCNSLTQLFAASAAVLPWAVQLSIQPIQQGSWRMAQAPRHRVARLMTTFHREAATLLFRHAAESP